MSKTIIRFKKKTPKLPSWPWLIAVIFIAVCGYVVLGGDISGVTRWVKSATYDTDPPVKRTLKGYATVRDGDTIVLNGETIRLEGIDAFELSQTCGKMTCGLQARSELRRLTLEGPVTCDDIGRDTYDRVLGLCRDATGTDINEAMVLSGYAIAYLYYTDRYEAAQNKAKSQRAGAWAQDFIEPYEYRSRNR